MWKAGWSPSLQAEEDKEDQTDSQLDASSSQTVTPVAEPLSAEPAPPDGPTSNLGPLDLLSREELLTDTSNSSSSTGEEGEAGGPHSFALVIPIRTCESRGVGTQGRWPGVLVKQHSWNPALMVMWPGKAGYIIDYVRFPYTSFQVDFILVSPETEP